MLNIKADVAIIADMPTAAKIVWIKSPTVMPAPVAMPTLVPLVVALAMVNSVAGPGIKTNPKTIKEYVIKVEISIIALNTPL